jgi:hypothetical protein
MRHVSLLRLNDTSCFPLPTVDYYIMLFDDFFISSEAFLTMATLFMLLEPVYCKKRQKKSQPRDWFGE